MSASRRRLARLPLEIFEDLQGYRGATILSSEELRLVICEKLKCFRARSSQNSKSRSVSLKTVGDFLRTSPLTIMQALDPLLTFAEVKVLFRRICHQCCARPVTCKILMARTTKDWDALLLVPAAAAQLEPISTLLSQPDTPLLSSSAIGDRLRYLPTGLPTLDNLGGIRLQSVTEVVGRSGAGKTQLALQMVVMAAKYNQGAMYIDTEKKLILERLRDMAARRVPQFSSEWHNREGDYDDRFPRGMSSTSFSDSQDPPRAQHERLFSFKAADQVLQNMTVKQPHSTQELLNVLEAVEEEILLRNQQSSSFPVRLLIVDSIAAPLKRDFGPHSIPQRAATAFSIAQTLKRLAEQLHLAVIVINQVGIDGQQQQQQQGTMVRWDQTAVRASLGTSWHHCVSTRILVDHDVDPHRDANSTTTISQAQNSHHRRLNVVKSNWMPPLAFPFTITPVGIVEL